MKKYELALVIDPTLTDDKVKVVIKKIEDLIATEKGKVTSKDIWPKKTLAYKIAKHSQAYYAILKIEVANIPPATNREWTVESGEKREEAEFTRCVAWNKLAELCSQLLSKGRKVYVEGRLQT